MRKQFSRGLQTLDKSTVSQSSSWLQPLFALWFTPICNPPCTHSLNTHFPFVRTTDCPSFRPCLSLGRV